MELNYKVCRMETEFTEQPYAVLICACENMAVAEEVAKIISRTIWQGHRIGIYVGNDEDPTKSYLKK